MSIVLWLKATSVCSVHTGILIEMLNFEDEIPVNALGPEGIPLPCVANDSDKRKALDSDSNKNQS